MSDIWGTLIDVKTHIQHTNLIFFNVPFSIGLTTLAYMLRYVLNS